MKLLCDKIYLSIHKLALYVREEHPKKIIITFHQASSPKIHLEDSTVPLKFYLRFLNAPAIVIEKNLLLFPLRKTELAD